MPTVHHGRLQKNPNGSSRERSICSTPGSLHRSHRPSEGCQYHEPSSIQGYNRLDTKLPKHCATALMLLRTEVISLNAACLNRAFLTLSLSLFLSFLYSSHPFLIFLFYFSYFDSELAAEKVEAVVEMATCS